MLCALSSSNAPSRLVPIHSVSMGWDPRLQYPATTQRPQHRHGGRVYVGPAGVRTYDPDWRAKDPRYAALRDAHLALHPRCEAHGPACAGRREVHHVGPRHLYPELRYVAGNLMTLCEWHHLYLAHAGEWYGWNSRIRGMALAASAQQWTAAETIRRAEAVRIYRWVPYSIVHVPRQAPAGQTSIIGRVVAWGRRLLSA